jgi:hypothetical protein
MFSGIHCTPMTHRASIAVEGVSVRISPDRIPSESSDFICRSRVAYDQPGLAVGGDCRIQASWILNSSENCSYALTLTQLSASNFSMGVAPERSTLTHPASTFLPNERMIESRSSSLDPITR